MESAQASGGGRRIRGTRLSSRTGRAPMRDVVARPATVYLESKIADWPLKPAIDRSLTTHRAGPRIP